MSYANPNRSGYVHGPMSVRFWRYVDKRGETECWPWLGYRDKDGYGKFATERDGRRSNEGAHRVAVELATGERPGRALVLHSCNNPWCVNPSHLRVGDQAANMADRRKAGNEPHGERHPNAKVTDAEVAQIRASIGPAHEVGKLFGISASQVKNIRRGDQRKDAS